MTNSVHYQYLLIEYMKKLSQQIKDNLKMSMVKHYHHLMGSKQFKDFVIKINMILFGCCNMIMDRLNPNLSVNKS